MTTAIAIRLALLTLGQAASPGAGSSAAPGTGGAAATGPTSVPAPPPAIAPVDRMYLAQAARRAVESNLKTGVAEPLPYVPPSLADLVCVTHVSLRTGVHLYGTGRSGRKPVAAGIVEAVTDAMLTAAASKRPALQPEQVPTLGLEIELAGEEVPVGTAARPLDDLVSQFEPGIDGITIHVRGREIIIRPSQIVALQPLCWDEDEPRLQCDRYNVSLDAIWTELGLNRKPQAIDAKDVSVARFRTRHLWQPHAGAPPIELTSGARIIALDEITPAHLDAIIDEAAAYLVRRQLASGLFSYEYFPSRDWFSVDEQSWIRQAAATWAVAAYARRTGDADARRCAERAIAAWRLMAKPHNDRRDQLCIAAPDGKRELGTSALVGLALLDAPDAEPYAGLASAIGAAIASLQNDLGRVSASFRPGLDETPLDQDYAPGEGLLMLARLYERTRDPRWRDTLDRALPYYQVYYREQASPAFIVWQMQAYAYLARTTRLQRYADYVFDMADRLVESQVRADARPHGAGVPAPSARVLSLYDGGFDVYRKGHIGISSAAYLEGLNEALLTARAFDDAERVSRYEDAVRHAARFIVQLQFRAEETYYVPNPAATVSGFRRAPFDNSLRIDNNQHALLALAGVRDLLWPDTPRTRTTTAPASRPAASSAPAGREPTP